jgi:hypothetical protein
MSAGKEANMVIRVHSWELTRPCFDDITSQNGYIARSIACEGRVHFSRWKGFK